MLHTHHQIIGVNLPQSLHLQIQFVEFPLNLNLWNCMYIYPSVQSCVGMGNCKRHSNIKIKFSKALLHHGKYFFLLLWIHCQVHQLIRIGFQIRCLSKMLK